MFLMNLWIVVKQTDCCNLKLKTILCVNVLLSQQIRARLPLAGAPLVETVYNGKNTFTVIKAVSRQPVLFLTKRKKYDGKSFRTPVNCERFGVRNIFNETLDYFKVDRLLKTESDIYVFMFCYLGGSQHACQSLAPLVETTSEKKYFHCKALSRFNETGRLYQKRLTTRSKKTKD